MKILRKLWPVGLIAGVCFVFFWKVFLRGAVLVPTDLMVGAYYPWKDNYELAVPYKNPLLSDSYSQLFLWKKLVVTAYQNGQWPLWNQFSYSGYPLLANIQSGALYPLNILMIVLPFIDGWNAFLISGVFLSCLTMYWLLRTLDRDKRSSLLGGVAYGFCGYSISWMEFATAGHSMIYLPLLFLVIEKYFQKSATRYLLWLVPLIYLLISIGHFQMAIYCPTVAFLYFLWQLVKNRTLPLKTNLFRLSKYVLCLVLGVLSAAALLLPAFELMTLSIRNIENKISGINYGLVPLKHLITLIAPDFYGNPATNNYWGTFNYHEVLIYAGIITFIAFIWAIFNFKKLSFDNKFFFLMMLGSLFLFFDTPIGQLFYQLNIPGIGTSSAGRIAIFFAFGGTIILAKFIENIRNETVTNCVKFILIPLTSVLLSSIILITIKTLHLHENNPFFTPDITNISVALRNLILPTVILISFLISTLLLRKHKIYYWLVGFIIVVDVFRFGWKYLPFSPRQYVFPATKVTDFLQQDKEIFRVDKEFGPLLSPNTWTWYGLMSPSGYDPMAIATYTNAYNFDLNGESNRTSRYAEISRYDSLALGKYNVKYLLALKQDGLDKISSNKLNPLINQEDWIQVMETPTVAILQNRHYLPRTFVENSGGIAKADIISYSANKIVINYASATPGKLLLLDSWYPGWVAKVNGKKTEIEKARMIFRGVVIEAGKGEVVFKYKPNSFQTGLVISILSITLWSILVITMFFKPRRSSQPTRLPKTLSGLPA